MAKKPTKPAVSKVKNRATPAPMPRVRSYDEQDTGIKIKKSKPKNGATPKPKKAPAKPEWENTWIPPQRKRNI